MGERQLDSWLSREVGSAWHSQPMTGAKMANIWQQGDKPDAEELIRSLGMEKWDTKPLQSWYERVLGASVSHKR